MSVRQRGTTHFSRLLGKIRQYVPAEARGAAVTKMLTEELESIPVGGTIRLAREDVEDLVLALGGGNAPTTE